MITQTIAFRLLRALRMDGVCLAGEGGACAERESESCAHAPIFPMPIFLSTSNADKTECGINYSLHSKPVYVLHNA